MHHVFSHLKRSSRAASVVLSFGAVALGSPSTAAAQTFEPMLTTGSPSGWTGTSGTDGLSTVTLEVGQGWVLRSISFGERRDRPCHIEAGFWRHENKMGHTGNEIVREGNRIVRPRYESEWKTADECEGGDFNRQSRRGVGISAEDVPRALRGVQVCQRRSNQRLKGISISGSQIQANGPSPDPGLDSTEERTNCNEWKPEVRCPQGEVAVALRVEFRGESAVGLALRCAPAHMEIVQP